MSSNEEFQRYKSVISDRHPSLSSVYGVSNELKLYLDKSSDAVVQSVFYNGWKSDHSVWCIFVFVPSGRVVPAIFDAAGCMHDSEISEWQRLYDKLQNFNARTGGTFIAVSVLDKSRYPFLAKSAQRSPLAETPEQINTTHQATSLL